MSLADTELLKSDQIDAFLHQAVQDGLHGTLSVLCEGKWNVLDIVFQAIDPAAIRVQVISQVPSGLGFKAEQPIGVCLQHDRYKYIFESRIADLPMSAPPTVLTVEVPDKIEKMQRRAYDRQPVPAELNVRAMFWHRGYKDDNGQAPEEHYWQGKLVNLSAGGAMIQVEPEIRSCFSVGQFLGVQFTPMSYQKPLLLEGHIRHLNSPPEDDFLIIGVEFLGLEASPEGREVLHRLVDIVDIYAKMNRPDD